MRNRVCVPIFLAFVVGVALANVAAAADSGLVGWWKFDDGVGTVAKDSSGNGYDGTIYDAVWVEGHLGGALEFAGAEYVDVPPESWSTIETQATVCFWAYGDPEFQPQANFIFGAFQDPADNESRVMSAHVPWSSGTVYFDTGGVLGGPYDRISLVGDAADYEGTWSHWTLLKNADTGDQQIYLNGELWHSGTGMTATMTGVTKFTIGTKPSLAEGWYYGMMDDFRLYDRALSVDELPDIMLGKGPGLELAGAPSPENEAIDVPRDVVLGWTEGEFAATHDVYIGTVFEDVNDASRANPMDLLVSQGQTETAYAPPAVLELGQTYYWRVDEVNGAPDNTIFKGEVWSFTVEPLAYPIAGIVATSNGVSEAGVGPERTVDGSGLNADDQHSTTASDMWLALPGADPLQVQYEFDAVYKLHEMLVWNYNVQFELMLGFGIKDVTVEYSVNGADWTALGDVEFAQATAKAGYAANTTVAFDGVAAKYVRLMVNSGHGPMGQFGLSEVRFTFIPVQAREPQPADGATDVSVDTALAWRAGRDAVSHEVYLGVDAAALELAGAPDTAGYDPGVLDLGTVYYWKVDETSDAVWEGPVWSFTTQEYLVVEDFESYDDDENPIFETWIDGLSNDTGSIVGYFNAPFAEQTIVHGGRQSMPLEYDNTGVTTAEADFDLTGDWSISGVQSLTLYFYGDVTNTVAQLYVKINGTRIDYDGPAINITRPSWQTWSIDLAGAGNVSSVSSLTIGIEGAGATGLIFVDDIRLYPEVLDVSSADITGAGDTVQGVPNDDDWPAAEYPALAIDDDTATKYLHRKGGSMATGFQVAPLLGSTIVTGLTFTTANDDYGRDPTSFELSGSNTSIDGPYELIAAGDIVDLAQDAVWPRFTKTETPIEFENTVAYTYYQIVFPTLRSNNDGLMQIAEVELIGSVAP